MTTRYNIAQLLAQNTSDFPDNTTQAITPAILRQFLVNFLETVRPSYASMRETGSLVLPLTAVASVIKPWSLVGVQDPPEMLPDLANGTITHAVTSLGNTDVVDRVTFYIGVSGPAGSDLTFTLFANGVATDVIARCSTTGAANIVTATLSGLLPQAADTVYDVRVASSTNSNFTFTNGTLRVENVIAAT